MAKRKCKGKTKAGKRCSRPAMKGSDTCLAHADSKEKEARGFGGAQKGGGRPAKARVVDVVRERIEEDMDRWYRVLIDASEATRTVVVGAGETAEAIEVPDHPTRLRAFAEAMDRAYGKPKQATELSGPDGGPIEVNDALNDPEVRKAGREYRRRVEAARAQQSGGSGSGD